MWDANYERFRCLIAPCPKSESQVLRCKVLFFKFLYLNFNIWKDSVYIHILHFIFSMSANMFPGHAVLVVVTSHSDFFLELWKSSQGGENKLGNS